jgi:hypothetical protein
VLNQLLIYCFFVISVDDISHASTANTSNCNIARIKTTAAISRSIPQSQLFTVYQIGPLTSLWIHIETITGFWPMVYGFGTLPWLVFDKRNRSLVSNRF